jgi:hypothetical protein
MKCFSKENLWREGERRVHESTLLQSATHITYIIIFFLAPIQQAQPTNNGAITTTQES